MTGKLHIWRTLAAAALLAMATPAVAEDNLMVAKVGGADPIMDPASKVWSKAKAISVEMLPQNVATPNNLNPAVKKIDVKAVRNDNYLGVLLTWKDPSRNDTLLIDAFGDEVALEFPVEYKKDDLPSPMMGNPGGRVAIWQWRAALQRDLDKGVPDTKDLYPNAHYDIYPDKLLTETDARPYSGARGLGNRVSMGKGTPVLEALAEGFGSLTDRSDTGKVNGKGVYKDGSWQVVFTYPLFTNGGELGSLKAGAESSMALAVWDGGSQEVGPRKAWSQWVALRLE